MSYNPNFLNSESKTIISGNNSNEIIANISGKTLLIISADGIVSGSGLLGNSVGVGMVNPYNSGVFVSGGDVYVSNTSISKINLGSESTQTTILRNNGDSSVSTQLFGALDFEILRHNNIPIATTNLVPKGGRITVGMSGKANELMEVSGGNLLVHGRIISTGSDGFYSGSTNLSDIFEFKGGGGNGIGWVTGEKEGFIRTTANSGISINVPFPFEEFACSGQMGVYRNNGRTASLNFHTSEFNLNSITSYITKGINNTGIMGVINNGILQMGTLGDAYCVFFTNSLPRMIINSNGQGAIGRYFPGLASRFIVNGYDPGPSTYSLTATDGQATPTFRVRDDGLIIIPKVNDFTTSESPNLYADAQGWIYVSVSSEKYKTGIRDYDKGIEYLQQLKPVYFNSITAKEAEKTYAGFIAEQVDAIGMSEFVKYGKDNKPDGVNYGNITALLVKSVQELNDKVQNLEQIIHTLTGKSS